MSGLERIVENLPLQTEEEKVEKSGKPTHMKFRNQALSEFDAENDNAESKEFNKIYLQAATYYADKNDDDALQCYVQAATIARHDGPQVFECYKNIGNILLRIGDLTNAESFYLKAYTINPDSDTLLVNFATLEMQKGEFHKALERYRAAVQINSKNERAWVGLAVIHREYGDHDLAWANIEKALDINSVYLIALDLAFEWGIKDSRFDKLIHRAQSFLDGDPNNCNVRVKLAKALICGQRLAAARRELAIVLQQETNNEEAKELEKLLSEQVELLEGATRV